MRRRQVTLCHGQSGFCCIFGVMFIDFEGYCVSTFGNKQLL